MFNSTEGRGLQKVGGAIKVGGVVPPTPTFPYVLLAEGR